MTHHILENKSLRNKTPDIRTLCLTEEYSIDRTKILAARGLPQDPKHSMANHFKVERMLKHINADCDYETYRNVIWALESLNWRHTFEMQYDWSISAPSRFCEHTLINLIKSYRPGHFSFRTLMIYAKNGSWDERAWQEEQRLNDMEHPWKKKLLPQERTNLLLLKWGSNKDQTK